MNTDEQREQQHAVEARAGTAGVDLAEHDVHERRRAADRREAVVLRVDRSRSRCRSSTPRRGPRPRARTGSPCPPCSRPTASRSTVWLAPTAVSLGLPFALEDHRDQRDREPEHEHRAEHRDALFDVAGHLPERPREARTGSRAASRSRAMFVIGFGFSNGCAELALYGPPPFSPISLIASWLAIGPPGIVCVWPVTVVTVRAAWKFWTAPWLTSTSVKTIASGSRTRMVVRTRSTQKLPSVCVRRRTRPRISATATAAPAAADTKLCSARPAIWVRCDIVDSPT